jgi:hypothetical protein
METDTRRREPLTSHEQWRWSRWVQWCEHAALLSVVPQVLRLAQEAENDAEYRSTLAWQARLRAQWQAIHDDLWAMDEEWSWIVLAHRPAPRHPAHVQERLRQQDEEPEDPDGWPDRL